MNDTPDVFDEIFFKNHGVGQFAADPEFEQIAHTLDKSEPTMAEREFCRLIVAGDSNAEAYAKTFDKENTIPRKQLSSYAGALLKRDRVANFLYDLRKDISELADETLPNLIAELNEDRKLARDMGQPGAAIAAVKAKASILGLESQTRNTTNINLSLSEDQKGKLLERIGASMRKPDAIDADFEDVTE